MLKALMMKEISWDKSALNRLEAGRLNPLKEADAIAEAFLFEDRLSGGISLGLGYPILVLA
ncbi:MAG: hypothetical protein ACI8UO_002511 [Verrucomicrobiales bacterium]|jgi:hypothetical protein